MWWTAGRGALISARMASRFLLTLLALLTGLAAQIAPAQARVSAEQTTAVAMAISVAPRVSSVTADLARLPEPGRRHARLVAGETARTAGATVTAPAVLIGIDRARE